MKLIVIILITLIVFACQENEPFPLSENKKVSDFVNADSLIVSKSLTETGIIGSFKEALDYSHPKALYLSSIIRKGKINEEVISGTEGESEHFTTYLGKLKLNGELYHVFKEFWTLQAAIVKHGHSELIFLNKKNVSIYDVEMPENLPFDLKNDLFRYVEKKDTVSLKLEHLSNKALVLGN